MKRRDFIATLGRAMLGGAAAWPLSARGQQPAVIGFLNGGSSNLFAIPVRAFHQGLADAGYVEGRNVTVEYRWAETRYDRLPALAQELVQRGATVMVAGGIPATLAAKALGTKIPIIFYVGETRSSLGWSAA
jgi:putative ABC transport system substrate-binding protein